MEEESESKEFKAKIKQIGSSGWILVPMWIIKEMKLEVGSEIKIIIKK